MITSTLPLFLLFIAILVLTAVRAQEQDTRPAEGSDISAINNLSNYDKPHINIDPKLRRALLRVLNKLEEEDNKRSKEHGHPPDTENVVNEEDFVKYFQNHDATKEFFDDIGTSKETTYQQHQQQQYNQQQEQQQQQEYGQQQYHQHRYEKEQQPEIRQPDSEYNQEEILSFSTQDDVKDEKDYYNAPPTSPTEEEHQHHANHQDSSLQTPTTEEFQNPDKYPSTIPTPNRDALYFQIPEPITLPDPTEENHNVTESRNVQRQATGGNSLPDNDNDKVHFVKTDVSVKLGGFRPTPITGPVQAEDKQTTRNSTTKKVKLEKHEVEFLQAPLLTAFTVQQDELGLPRRVIPLNYQGPGPIVLPKVNDNNKEFDQQQSTRQSELDAKQRLLDQQLKFLQDQQLRQQEYFKIQEFKLKQQRLLEEEKQKQILLLNQQRELENLQRSILQRQRQQDLLLGKHQQVDTQQLEVLKQQEQQRFPLQQQPRLPAFQQQNQQQQLAQLQQEQPPPLPVNQKTVEFQRSVDFQFRPPFPLTLPNTNFQSNFDHFQQNLNNFQSQFLQPTPSASSSPVELNRINRKEPSNFVGNQGLNQPVSVDSRLQNLFYQSGLTRDLRGAQEDLNIVTKVLALDPHGRSHQHQFQQSSRFPLPLGQYQAASTRVEHKVEAPSTLITPPPEKL